ncbi:MAG TPA: hypothetical protein VLK85_08450 [Ramlibacter sp.]|nr:hypothetical protein [Ramlibacter sp.]
MRNLVRGAAMLLLLGLAGASLALEEIRFVLAGVSISCLVEIGLALRARRSRAQAPRDRSRVSAAQVSCTEKDGALTVALIGEDQGPGGAPYVLLSRTLRPERQAMAPNDDRPYLELSDPRWSVYGGIQDAYLSPQLLRLTLDARGAEVLGASQVCVTLQAGNDQRRLERTLGRILRGVSFTSERSMPEDTPDIPPSVAQ